MKEDTEPEVGPYLRTGAAFFKNEAVCLAGMFNSKALTSQNLSQRGEQNNYKCQFTTLIAIVKSYSVIGSACLAALQTNNISSQDKFVKYHTTAVSTGLLCQRAQRAVGAIWNDIFTPAELGDIAVAIANSHLSTGADNISEKMILHTQAWIDANDIKMEKWYQGARAVEEADPRVYQEAYALYSCLKTQSDERMSFAKCKSDYTARLLAKVLNDSTLAPTFYKARDAEDLLIKNKFTSTEGAIKEMINGTHELVKANREDTSKIYKPGTFEAFCTPQNFIIIVLIVIAAYFALQKK
jgi:hypothetical protein